MQMFVMVMVSRKFLAVERIVLFNNICCFILIIYDKYAQQHLFIDKIFNNIYYSHEPKLLDFLNSIISQLNRNTVTYESVVSLGCQAGVCGVHKAFSDQKQIEPTLIA